MAAIQKIYDLIKGCNTQIKGFEKRGFTDCTFSAMLYLGKKQLNGIEQAGIENFSALLRDYFKTEQPDRIKLDFHGYGPDGNKRTLYTKTYNCVDEHGAKEILPQSEPAEKNLFAGLGEAEVMEMVDRKVSELERVRELDRLKTALETLRREHDDTLLKNEELTAKVDAQSTIETYASIAGKAAPILSAIFGANPLVATAASMLAGVANPQSDTGNANGDPTVDHENKATIIRLIQEFLTGLNDTELADLYSLMAKMQQDRTLIGKLTQHLGDPGKA